MKDKVGIGFIGTGFARKVQIPAFLECEGVKLVSIASGRAQNAADVAAEFGFEHHTDDWRQTLSHPDVDLVCITTPPVLHREMTLFAIEHNKHILGEKPMAMNAAEAAEMLAAAANNPDKLALIDHELRFQPGRQIAYRMLRDGAIGKIRHLKWNFRAPHRGDAATPWNWWSDIEMGGGALGAINSHIIDSFQWFLGTTIKSVACQLQTHIKQRPFADGFRDVTTDDEANMLLRFADGELTDDATGLVSVSMVEYPEYQNRCEFFGASGAIRIDYRGDVYLAKAGRDGWEKIETPFVDMIAGAPDTGFSRGFAAFAPKIVEAIRTGNTIIEHAATFADGLKVQNVLDAAREANATQRVVKIRY